MMSSFHDALGYPSYSHASNLSLSVGEQEWRSGESARLPPMCPGLDSRTRRYKWIEFVFGSRPCSEGFLRVFRLSSLSKTNISKFQFDREFECHGFISWRLLCVILVKQNWLILFIYLVFIMGACRTDFCRLGSQAGHCECRFLRDILCMTLAWLVPPWKSVRPSQVLRRDWLPTWPHFRKRPHVEFLIWVLIGLN